MQIVNTVTDICAVMDSDGVDIYFLNREPILNVTNAQSIRQAFNAPPKGMTPIAPAIRRILASKRSQAYEKKLLLLIATDGYGFDETFSVTFLSLLMFILVHLPMNTAKRILAHWKLFYVMNVHHKRMSHSWHVPMISKQ